MRFVFNWLLLVVVVSGILCFTIFMLINIGVFKPNFQLPLYAVTEIIEKEDKVYVGLGEYNRIQVYDKQGNYLTKMDVFTYGKKFDFYFDENSVLHYRVLIGQKTENTNSEFHQYLSGNVYQIKSQFPLKIYKKTHKTNTLFLQDSVFFSLYSSPFGSWFISLIALIVLGMFNYPLIMDVMSSNIDKNLKMRFIIKKMLRKV
ncbi:MAG: hypothetical protein ACKO7P_13635 [Bacteroidota bacterium]